MKLVTYTKKEIFFFRIKHFVVTIKTMFLMSILFLLLFILLIPSLLNEKLVDKIFHKFEDFTQPSLDEYYQMELEAIKIKYPELRDNKKEN